VAVISISSSAWRRAHGAVRDATILEHNIVQTAGRGRIARVRVAVTMPTVMILGSTSSSRVLLVSVLGGLLGSS